MYRRKFKHFALLIYFFLVGFKLYSQNYVDQETGRLHLPSKIMTEPAFFEVPEPFNEKLNLTKIILEKFEPKLLKRLSEEELEDFIKAMGQIPIKIQWYFDKAYVQSSEGCCQKKKWHKINAAAALAIFMGATSQSKMLAKMIAIAPNLIVKHLRGGFGLILDAHVTAMSLKNFVLKLNSTNQIPLAMDATRLSRDYVKYWYEKDAKDHSLVLSNLVFEIAQVTQKVSLSTEQKGLLMGGMLAGALLHAKEIDDRDEQRLWTVNTIANMVWAGTSFISLIPIAGNITTFLGGVISVGAVIWTAIDSATDNTPDMIPDIKKIEGLIGIEVKKKAEGDDKKMLDALEYLSWIHDIILMNGL